MWVDFFNDFRKGRYLSANNDLDCIWTILGGEKNVEGGEEDEKYKEIEEKLKKTGTIGNGFIVKGFSGIDEAFVLKASKQKILLLEKAMFLRRLQNKQGKGTAYERGEAEYMDE